MNGRVLVLRDIRAPNIKANLQGQKLGGSHPYLK